MPKLPAYLQTEYISHTRRVMSLYKKMCRDLYYHEVDYFEVRFKQLQIRKKFEDNMHIKDMRKAKMLLEEAEADFKSNIMHPAHQYDPRPFHPFSKWGISENREKMVPDYVMDWYHPLEKAQYPYFFAKREQMKDEYLTVWKKKMLSQTADLDNNSSEPTADAKVEPKN